MYHLAGSGLRAVQNSFFGEGGSPLTNRQANHLLHSVAGSIFVEPLDVQRTQEIKGTIEVSDTPYIHHLDPRREDYEIDGVVGGVLHAVLFLSISDLEDDLGFDITEVALSSASASKLADALNKNIENNIVKAQGLKDLEDDLAEIEDLISEPSGYGIVALELDRDSVFYRVRDIKVSRGDLVFSVEVGAEYFIYAERLGRRNKYFDDF